MTVDIRAEFFASLTAFQARSVAYDLLTSVDLLICLVHFVEFAGFAVLAADSLAAWPVGWRLHFGLMSLTRVSPDRRRPAERMHSPAGLLGLWSSWSERVFSS